MSVTDSDTAARCSECHYKLSIHFYPDGRPRGCPMRLTGRAGDEHDYPRIIIRPGRGTRREHTIVIWADIRDGENLLMWDRVTGEQFWSTVRAACSLVRRGEAASNRDAQAQVQEDIEYEIGGPVRVITVAYKREGKRVG